ncbi:hypothetical protein NKH77_47875 [Streptomyces sp. M19]
MLTIDAEETVAALPFTELIPALREGSSGGAHPGPAPPHHRRGAGRRHAAADALVGRGVPRRQARQRLPRQRRPGQPALSSAFVLADARTGRHLAVIDGDELTRRRTVATSALGASYLARPDSATLLVVGTGHIGSLVADAYRAVFDLKTVLVHGRTAERAERLAETLRGRASPPAPSPTWRPPSSRPTSSAAPRWPPSR